ncbi:diacylglycerol kinase [Aeromonas enteropelogenes]|uniref:Diacylglycerol kinase n=1 Tax=Aeromonas enteropelogenes TaxID=29489 RepID=A0ABU9J7I5_AEREN|nr:diacylglycerol kinase [Aeromonas enteropelogenes]MBL0458531.1 diacylglycerol kinase [Aeromonas enteropelogenes]RQM61106.1 diacylglycerol kinase [Aeromonas enteropelogenes]UAK71024.1 diacylglycerol kinase [Aeromonas enteropelogenes]UBH52101.1 diacylglycerol kinase [Aeromonas enteropelogenes]UCA09363.1 diacylglycerol kinase [Aeromonas enteropelogenes]
MAKPGATGVTRIIKATGYSMKGLKSAWINEAAFRQELMLILLLMPLTFWVGETLNQILLLVIISWLVVIVEVLNSAIEAVVDRIGPEHHELSGRAKDLGSAAVFIALALNALVWGALVGRNLLGWW